MSKDQHSWDTLTYTIISTTCICIISADLRCIEPRGNPGASLSWLQVCFPRAGVTWAGAASHHNTVPPPEVRAFPGPEQRDATFVVSSLLWPHLSFMLHQYRNLTITFCLMLLTRNIFKSIIGTFKLAKILLSKDHKIWIKYLLSLSALHEEDHCPDVDYPSFSVPTSPGEVLCLMACSSASTLSSSQLRPWSSLPSSSFNTLFSCSKCSNLKHGDT